MSFSASWGNQEADVCQPDAASDLALEKAVLSPPLDSMADDVRAVVEECGVAAASVVGKLPSRSGLYAVSASGHVRQGDTDRSSVTIQVAEKS